MSKWKIMLLAGAMTFAPVPVYAQQGEAPVAEVVTAVEASEAEMAEAQIAERKAEQQKYIDEMLATVGKLFDTGDLPPIDPARMQPATLTAAKLLPDGTMARIMDNMIGTFMKAVGALPDGFADMRLAMATGVDSEQLAALGPVKKAAIADIFDPHRKARADQTSAVLTSFSKAVFAELEPPMREGMARAYARKFGSDQLADINQFFATPTGGLFAGESFALQADREVLSSLFKAIPAMLPKLIEKGTAMEKDIKALPKEKTLADLSKAEMTKLADLLSIPVEQLEEQRDLYSIDTEMVAVDEAAEAAAAAADAAAMDMTAEVGEWTYSDNWSEEDRAAVDKLVQAHADVDAALTKAQTAAIERARIRMGGKPAPALPPGE